MKQRWQNWRTWVKADTQEVGTDADVSSSIGEFPSTSLSPDVMFSSEFSRLFSSIRLGAPVLVLERLSNSFIAM